MPPDRVIVTLRPPARSALYHRFENPLFEHALEAVNRDPRVYGVLVARTATWRASPRLRVIEPDRAIDGPNLVYWSDLVIGAGGTMTREAAVLGTPSYTVYGGRAIAVDDYLIGQGRLQRLTTPDDVARVALKKKQPLPPLVNRAGVRLLIDTVRQSARA